MSTPPIIVLHRLSLRTALARCLQSFAVLLLITGAARAQGVAMPNGRTLFGKSVTEPPQLQTSTALTAEEWALPIEVGISLKMRNFDELQARIGRGDIISPAEMAAKYYPLAADYDAVVAWVKQQGLEVTSTDPARLGVFFRGSAAKLSQVFVVSMTRATAHGKTYVSANYPPSLPTAIARPVLGVNGLQPQIQPRTRASQLNPTPALSNAPPFTPAEITKAYGGTGLALTGAGQKIGIVIDTFAANTDLTAFWNAAGVAQNLNNIENVQVITGALPAPSGEESLDVQWSSGVAPAAHVRVYATRSLLFVSIDQAYQRIINDLPSQPGLRQVSLSYGLGETYTAQSQMQTDAQYFATMAAAGVTVFVSSGDGGSSPGPGGHDHNGPIQTESPANDPSVTGVGGTSIFLNASTGAVTSERAWLDGGGAPSAFFSRPTWQVGLGVPAGSFRLVPDLASGADPNTGAMVYLNGTRRQYGGTSWSAPMWAGFCALINQARANAGLTSVGALNPKIYPLIGSANFRDIVSGTNGDFNAGPNYDLCTGVGVPNLSTLVQTLTRGGATGTQANLTFATPAGWSDTVVVSSVQGTNTDTDSFLTTQPLYVDYSPLNNGDVAVPSSWHGIIYIDDVPLDDAFFTAGLGVNTSTTVLDRALPPLPAGQHTLKVVLDTGDSVPELVETDNTFQKTIVVTNNGTIDAANLSFGLPNGWSAGVVVSTVTGTNTDAGTILSGDPIYVDYAPKNSGTVAVGSSYKARIFVDDILTFEETVPAGAAPNATLTNLTDRSLGTLSAGTHSIKVTLDPDNAIFELSEADNTFVKTIVVSAGITPNLTFIKPPGWTDKLVVSNVTGTTIDRTTLRTGDALYVDIAPWNNGGSAVPADWHAKIFVDDGLKYERTVTGGLGPNFYDTSILDLPINTLSAGSHVIKAVLDTNNDIAESIENDNTFQKMIVITSAELPNLKYFVPAGWSRQLVLSTVTGTHADAASFTTNDTIYFDYAPLNDGNVPINKGWHIRVFVDDEEKYSEALGLVSSKTFVDNLFDRTLPPLTVGPHTIRVELDADDEIGETNESDNSFSRTINVAQGFTNLTVGTPIVNIGGAAGSKRFFKFTVPDGQSALNVLLAGNNGDADLYVKRGDFPTPVDYDGRGFTKGTNETVTLVNPPADDYYVLLQGFEQYSNATLVVSFGSNFDLTATSGATSAGTVSGSGNFNIGETATVIATPLPGFAFLDWTENGNEVSVDASYSFVVGRARALVANFAPLFSVTSGVPVTGLADAAGSVRLYQINVPAGAATLSFTTTGGTGNVDLYIRSGAPATFFTNDGSSTGSGTVESLVTASPAVGPWYVQVRGVTAYAGVHLQVTVDGMANIAATAEPFLGGTVSGGGAYQTGTNVSLTASPANGYTFLNFTEGGNFVQTGATLSFPATADRTLVANFVPTNLGTTVGRNAPTNNIFDALKGQKVFKLAIPAGARNLVVTTTNGHGNLDLYLKFGSPAALDDFDKASATSSANETITVAYPPAGTCYFLIYGKAAYSGASLTATYDFPGAGGSATLTLSASPAVGGRISSGGTYAAGAELDLTAQANPGFVFEGWTENDLPQSTARSFHYTLNGDHHLVARFAAAPALSLFEGTYDGLAGQTDTVAADGGFVHFTVSATGNVSGYLLHGGKRFTFKGPFDNSTYRLSVNAKSGKLTAPLNLRAQPDSMVTVAGDVNPGAGALPVVAVKGAHNKKSKLPKALTYTVLLPPDPAFAANATYPKGYGYARLTVSTLGVTKLTGKLGDGTSLSSAASLSSDGRIAIYAAPYAAKGVLFGWSTFEDLPATDLTGDLRWMKPTSASGAYLAGFNGHIALMGAAFAAPAARTPVIALPVAGADITLTGPDGAARTQRFTVGDRSKVTITGTNTNSLKLTLTPSNGSVTGSMTKLGEHKAQAFKGMLMQKQSFGAGYYVDGGLTFPFELRPAGP